MPVLCAAGINLTVPRRTNRPEELVTGRAVCAVRGVRMACSIVPGLPPCVPGRTNPLKGRPDWEVGLVTKQKIMF